VNQFVLSSDVTMWSVRRLAICMALVVLLASTSFAMTTEAPDTIEMTEAPETTEEPEEPQTTEEPDSETTGKIHMTWISACYLELTCRNGGLGKHHLHHQFRLFE